MVRIYSVHLRHCCPIRQTLGLRSKTIRKCQQPLWKIPPQRLQTIVTDTYESLGRIQCERLSTVRKEPDSKVSNYGGAAAFVICMKHASMCQRLSALSTPPVDAGI